MKIVARIAVTFTKRHVDAAGWPTHEAELFLWEAIAGAPADAQVRLDIGPVRYCTHGLARALREGLGPNATVAIEGRASYVGRWIDQLTELTDERATISLIGRAA